MRIVSLAPGLTDLLFRLGVGDAVVGVTRYCESPPEAKTRPKIGGVLDPSFEAILALKPTLVVGIEGPAAGPLLTRLEELGVSGVAVSMYDLEQTYAAMRVIGEAVGRAEEAARLTADLGVALDAVEARLRGAKRPRVMLVYGHKPLVVAGPGSFGHQLIEMAGGNNVAADAPMAYPRYGFEEVVRHAPDVILDAYMGADAPDEATALAFWQPYAVTPAVKHGRVYHAARPELLQPGPRLGEGLAWLARTLHPARFPSL